MVADPTRPATWIVPSDRKLSLSYADLTILVRCRDSSVLSGESRSEAMAPQAPRSCGGLKASAAAGRTSVVMKGSEGGGAGRFGGRFEG